MIAGYFIVLLLLSIYSYSQIDLNLTLFQAPLFLDFQNFMIQIGYFNRPLSSLVYLLLLGLMFLFYWKLKVRNWKLMVGAVVLTGLVSYPFLSHDIFNYLFDARIVTNYHLNPYFFKALDFPADPWIRFMNWTHRTYPYGPVWILVTLAPSALGFGKFVLTLLNFKLMFAAVYIVNCWLINKINPRGLKFFALNPLIILETLYSPHNEALMLTFLLFAIYWYKNKTAAVVSLIFSGGVKFLTWLLAPFIFLDREKFIKVSLIVIAAGLVPVVFQREPYPWYLVTLIGLVALIPENKKLHWLIGLISLGTLLRYLPYIYTGDYSTEMQIARNVLTILPLGLGILIYGVKNIKLHKT